MTNDENLNREGWAVLALPAEFAIEGGNLLETADRHRLSNQRWTPKWVPKVGCSRVKNIGRSMVSTAEEWDLVAEIASSYCKSPKSSMHPLQREILERITHNALLNPAAYHYQEREAILQGTRLAGIHDAKCCGASILRNCGISLPD